MHIYLNFIVVPAECGFSEIMIPYLNIGDAVCEGSRTKQCQTTQRRLDDIRISYIPATWCTNGSLWSHNLFSICFTTVASAEEKSSALSRFLGISWDGLTKMDVSNWACRHVHRCSWSLNSIHPRISILACAKLARENKGNNKRLKYIINLFLNPRYGQYDGRHCC